MHSGTAARHGGIVAAVLVIATFFRSLYALVVDQRTGSGWRLPQLDGLRGIAAMMVLLSHVLGRTPGVGDGWWWAPIERGGAGGVVLFFALSGFLLYLPWLRSQVEGRSVPRLRDYAIRRCLRIMPAYYVSVVALAVFRVLLGGRDAASFEVLALHFAFLPTLGAPLQTVYWTLQTEEFFYWLLPALHCVVARYGALLTWLCSCAIAAAWAGAGGLTMAGATLRIWLEQTPLFLPAFALGIATAVAWERSRGPERAQLYGLIGFLGYIAIAPLASWIARETDHLLTPVTMLMMAPFASLAVLAAARGGVPFLEHPILRFLGGISFSLYLWHFVVIRFAPVPSVIVDQYWLRVLYTTAISVPVATVSFLAVERPFLRLRPSVR